MSKKPIKGMYSFATDVAFVMCSSHYNASF